MLEAALDAKVTELAAQYAKSWREFLKDGPRQTADPMLVSREGAVEMLGVSVSSTPKCKARIGGLLYIVPPMPPWLSA
jgi:hypothetical protein